jgi:cobalt-zinc-cadmium efflux system membrane fusion protein
MILKPGLYILLISCLVFSCGKKEETQSEGPSPKEEPSDGNFVTLTREQYNIAGIQIGKVEKKNLSSVIKVNGVLDVPPQNLVSISAPLGGFVKETELLQGMRVKKGQTLAIIENPEYIQLQQDYLENLGKVEYMLAEFARQKELSEENISSSKIFQQTTSELKTVKARLAGIEQKLQMVGINPKNVEEGKISRVSSIISPISGYVTAVNVNIGKYITATDVMFEIVNTDHLHVELTVFEKDVPKLKEGQKVRYTLAEDPSKERTASIYLIGRAISKERNVRVHAHMDEEDIHLLPGMYVKALIETGSNTVDALPEDAVLNSLGKNYIYVNRSADSNGFRFEMVEIKTGTREDGFIEVSLPEDLRNSQKIVVKGTYSLISKMKNVEEEE